jgi:thymidylate kinase
MAKHTNSSDAQRAKSDAGEVFKGRKIELRNSARGGQQKLAAPPTADMHSNTNAVVPWIVVTGLDGAGKTTLVKGLTERYQAHRFKLPYHDFVRPALARSGNGRPYDDVLTDRLLFALDARLTNYLVREWRRTERAVVSQRGWMDNYVFGAVQGVSWTETGQMLQTADLERPSAVIHLAADPHVAFERIRLDPKRDKYEVLTFMRKQYRETRRLFDAVALGDPALSPFLGIPSLWIDTTDSTVEQVLAAAEIFLVSALGTVQPRPDAEREELSMLLYSDASQYATGGRARLAGGVECQ